MYYDLAVNFTAHAPPPGHATVEDVIEFQQRENRLFELVDGTLVKKAMGYRESALAIWLIEFLAPFVRRNDLGIVTGEAGMMQLFSGLVRIPDIAFVSWERLPNERMPTEPVPNLVPDLAVEVLSAANTMGEMARKRHEYFAAGVRLLWLIDPATRTIAVYNSADKCSVLTELDTLIGGEVLPGFTLPLSDLFAELDRTRRKLGR